ncbi:MAG TPA: hypothetical protein VLA84_02195, partial [Microcoleus sp.]|nr:hypothetical protein [Microcoleus sp.]
MRNFKLNFSVKNIIPVSCLEPRISNLESQHPSVKSFTSVTSRTLLVAELPSPLRSPLKLRY